MKFTKNSNEFEEGQLALTRAIGKAIRKSLRDAMPRSRDDADETAEEILFHIGAILDGASSATGDSVPFLTYSSLTNGKRAVWDERGPGIHELAESVFDSEDSEEADHIPGEGRTFEAEVKFESGIAVGYMHVGLEEEFESKQDFAAQFFRIFYPTKDRNRHTCKISSISPLMANIREVVIATANGKKRIREEGLADLSIGKLYDRITQKVEPA